MNAPIPPTMQPPPGPAPGSDDRFPPEDVDEGRLWAVLGWVISPLWIIPLVQRDNAFAMYHAKQAMTYTIVMMIATIPISLIAFITCGIGVFVMFPLMYPWVMGLIYAAQGEYRPIPWFGHWAEEWFGNMVADQRPGGPQAPPPPPQAPPPPPPQP